MPHSHCRFFIWVILNLALVSLEARIFTSTDGTMIRGEIIQVDRLERVTLRREDGQLFRDISIELFSEADREYIRYWKAEEERLLNNGNLSEDSEIRVIVGTGRDKDTHYTYGYETNIVRYSPKVTIINEEIKVTYAGIKGTLYMIGQDVQRKEKHAIIFREDFVLDAPPGEKTEWMGKPFVLKVYPDYYGYDYEGYILLLRDHDDQIVFEKGSKKAWMERLNEISEVPLNTAYDRTFKTQITY